MPTRRRSSGRHRAMQVLGVLVVVHGAIHLFGAAKGFGWADVPALTQPISVGMGAAWLLAGVVTIAAGALLVASASWWWMVGAPAAVLSQIVIVTDWGDAAAGTVVNVLLAGAAVYAGAAHGPTSFESEYRRRAGRALAGLSAGGRDDLSSVHDPLTEEDLEALPAPVRRYVRRSGAVGKPPVDAFRAVIHGRIRAGADKPWMPFTGEQVNTYGPLPERFFKMDASRAHLPVDVLHVFTGDSATMRVKLCSLLPMVDASGAELTRAETVTLLNDLCVLAPAALVTARITWTRLDEHRLRAGFTRGAHHVTADLVFDQDDRLVDFTSDDRFATTADGKALRPRRWSTPLHDYRSFHGRSISASGLAWWHGSDPADDFAYLEFEVDDISYRARRGRPVEAPA